MCGKLNEIIRDSLVDATISYAELVLSKFEELNLQVKERAHVFSQEKLNSLKLKSEFLKSESSLLYENVKQIQALLDSCLIKK